MGKNIVEIGRSKYSIKAFQLVCTKPRSCNAILYIQISSCTEYEIIIYLLNYFDNLTPETNQIISIIQIK